MANIERYTVTAAGLVKSETGSFVQYGDYLALENDVKKLQEHKVIVETQIKQYLETIRNKQYLIEKLRRIVNKIVKEMISEY